MAPAAAEHAAQSPATAIFMPRSGLSAAHERLPDGASIGILCTAQGEVATNTDTGQSSSLWDGTTDGYVPDVFVDTGTNQATMGSC